MNKKKLLDLAQELPKLAELYAKCQRCGKDMEVKIILVCPDKTCKKESK
jgi:recombinational DNA repair protein RecR